MPAESWSTRTVDRDDGRNKADGSYSELSNRSIVKPSLPGAEAAPRCRLTFQFCCSLSACQEISRRCNNRMKIILEQASCAYLYE